MSQKKNNLKSVSAVILAAGVGSRLGKITKDTPKPLLEFGGKPFLSYLLDYVINSGIQDIVLTVYTHKEKIRSFLTRYGYIDKVTIVELDKLDTSAISAKTGLLYVKNQVSFILASDTISRFEFNKIFNYHRLKKSVATVMVTSNLDIAYGGCVKVKNNGRIAAVIADSEKNNFSNFSATKSVSPIPIFITNVSSALENIKEGDEKLVREPFNRLRPDVYAYQHDDFYLDFGTPDKYYSLKSNPELVHKAFMSS